MNRISATPICRSNTAPGRAGARAPLGCAAVGALAIACLGCQAILGIQQPVIGDATAAADGRRPDLPDGRTGMPDGPVANRDGGNRMPDAASPADGGSPAYPSVRTGTAMVYDPARGRLVLFGGSHDGTVLNDTWEWDGTRWTNVTPTSGNPPARADHMMVYDVAAGRTILFGGYDDRGAALGKTWAWNGKSWKDVTQTPSSGAYPPFRSSGGMAYDANHAQVVLFGGQTLSSRLDDTWTWDGTLWTNETFAPGSPPTREDFSLVYDADTQRVLLFGGLGDTEALADTWTWDGQNWSQQHPASSPAPRHGYAAAYDPSRKRVVVFGGTNIAGNPLTTTWEWDGTRWSNVTPSAGNPPAGRYAMAYDAAVGSAIMYAGGPTMWAWDGASWTAM